MLVMLKKAFQKPDSAAFIFWLLEVKVTKDCDDNWGGYNDQGAVCQFKSIVPYFCQYTSTVFIFLIASTLLIALALQTNANAFYLPISIHLAYLASQLSFLLFSCMYIFYILSSFLVIKTFKSLLLNLLRLSLSLRLFILLTVIIYLRSSAAVQQS